MNGNPNRSHEYAHEAAVEDFGMPGHAPGDEAAEHRTHRAQDQTENQSRRFQHPLSYRVRRGALNDENNADHHAESKGTDGVRQKPHQHRLQTDTLRL